MSLNTNNIIIPSLMDTKNIVKWVLDLKKWEIIISLICLAFSILFGGIGLVNIILVIPAVIIHVTSFLFFFMWIYRSVHNCQNLSLGSTRFTPVMAVVWFFLPVINWFYSVLVIQNIWEVNHKFDTNSLVKPANISWVTLWGVFRFASFLAMVFNIYNRNLYIIVDLIYMFLEYSVIRQISDLQDRNLKRVVKHQPQDISISPST